MIWIQFKRSRQLHERKLERKHVLTLPLKCTQLNLSAGGEKKIGFTDNKHIL